MPYADPLTSDELADALRRLSDWRRDGTSLVRTVRCPDFRAAIALVNAVADAAESADHHPDIALTGYRNVTFTLSTHAAGAITRRDTELARTIDELAAQDA